jgi:hypothetical protein
MKRIWKKMPVQQWLEVNPGIWGKKLTFHHLSCGVVTSND